MIIKIPHQILNLFYLLHTFTEYFARSGFDTYDHQVAFFINFPIKLYVHSLLPAKYASPGRYMHWIFKQPKYLFFLHKQEMTFIAPTKVP